MSTEEQKSLPREPPWPKETGIWASYNMHCHCGAIRWNIKLSPPLLEEEAQGKGIYTAMECHCSHCERNGMILAHPKQENVTFTQGRSEIKEYLSASKSLPHLFCPHCASYIGIDLTRLGEKMGPGELRYAINLRMLKDIPLEKLKIKQSYAARDMPPKYEI